jgi:penicillin-binding protein 1B
MSPLEVAGLYHTIAAEGVYTPLRGIREVLTADGKPLKRYPLELEQRFSVEAVFQLQYAMHLSLREGTARSVYDQIPLNIHLAGKTGTTNDQRDSWFAGFSGEHVAVVWIGKDDNTETPLSGAAGALKVWTDVITQINTQSLTLEPPPRVSFNWLDTTTGNLSAEGCEGALWLPVRDDFLPLESAECQQTTSSIRDFWRKLMN